MATSDDLREVSAAGRPLIEKALDLAVMIAALRDVATAKGLDWSQLKALLKAQILDERDDAGDGKRVRKIVEKAEFASAYADMLGLAKMNENNFSPDPNLVETIAQAVQTETGRKALGMALDVMIDAEEDTPPHDPETGEITEQPETANETAGPSSSLSGNDGFKTPVAKPMEARHEVAIETPPHTETKIVSGPSGAEPEATCEPSQPHTQPLRKTAADYRTHCLRPDACGASGLDHCFSCRQAMAERRVPA